VRYTVKRPDVCVIFLDTHAINTLAYANSFPAEDNKPTRELYAKLQALVEQKKILIYEADQMFEIGVRPELIESSSQVFATLARGLLTSKDVVEERQHVIGMKAFIEKSDSLEIPFESAFVGDPFEDRTIGGMVLRVDLLTPEMITSRQELNQSIATELEALRLQYIEEKVPEKERRERQTNDEFGGYSKVYQKMLSRYRARGGDSSDETEFWQEYNIIRKPFAEWKRHGGGTPEELGEFYESDYYKALPHVDIWSRLSGQKIIIGEPIRRGDVADMHNIEHFMPYTHIMVLDRAMIGLVKTLRLDEKYDVKICGLKDLIKLLPGVE